MTAAGTDARIVTLRTLPGRGGLESAPSGSPPTPEQQDALRRYARVVEQLEAETAASSPNVLVTAQDPETSLVQSLMAERSTAGPPLPAGGIEAKFGEGLTGGDLLGWLVSLFDHVDRTEWHAIVRPPDARPGTIADRGRVAVLSDWGTNLYGAPVSAASIARAGGYELLMHLGDIYYSGTPSEANARFSDVWPMAAARMSRALNGNHEMYSGGFAYYDEILPRFGQTSSYFALQNTHWLLVGLDTAQQDHDIDAGQADWLRAVVAAAGSRKVILFSHHQPFSRLDKQGPKLQAAMASLLGRQAITAWYWGHEHECVVYDRHPASGLLGRCVGNGGIPSPRKGVVLDAPLSHRVGDVAWKRLSATTDSPACLVLDGPNPFVKDEEKKFGPHGYLTLDFDGPSLVERLHLPGGEEIFSSRIG